MPLVFGSVGQSYVIKKISGNDKLKKYLSSIGFAEDAEITIVSKLGDNLIVKVKNVRIAISSKIARRIIV